MPPRKSARWSVKKLAITIARLADEKQAGNILVLDVAQAIQVADYFVVCDGQNRRHLNVIAQHVATTLKKDGFFRMGGSPLNDESWVLLDFGPVVLHCFSTKARNFYDIENLWGDCKRIRWQAPVRKKKASDAVSGPDTPTGDDEDATA